MKFEPYEKKGAKLVSDLRFSDFVLSFIIVYYTITTTIVLNTCA